MTRLRRLLPALAAAASVAGPAAAAPSAPQPGSQPLTVFTDAAELVVQDAGGQPVLRIGPDVWGPDWGFSGLSDRHGGFKAASGGGATGSFTRGLSKTDTTFTFRWDVTPEGPQALRGEARFEPAEETDLTLVVLSLTPGSGLQGADRLEWTAAGGTQSSDLPARRGPLAEGVSELTLTDEDGGVYRFGFEEPVRLTAEKDTLRVVIAEDHAPAGGASATFTLELPEEATFHLSAEQVPEPEGWSEWFAWDAGGDPAEPSVIGMADWLEKPAGRRGRVQMDGDRIVYGGEPMKVWGLNRTFAAVAPPRDQATRIADFYAKHGVNAVRLHKYANGEKWAGILQPDSSVAFDPQRLEDLDFFVAELKERGIYTKLSSNFGTTPLGKKELAGMPFAPGDYKEKPEGFFTAPQGALWFSPELQEVQARQLTGLLTHTNPHTGLRYADDPAVMVVELLNENTTFFNLSNALKDVEVTRERAGAAFAAYLRGRYADEAALEAAWGPRGAGRGGLDHFAKEGFEGESLDGAVYPFGNTWFQDPRNQPVANPRMLDTLNFLAEVQSGVYERLAGAVRVTGYDGMLVAGNWQAGRAVGHFLNLQTDAEIGVVDRHNYFDGPTSMLATPGGGTLSSGMQQVAGRPFMLSEWIHVVPNEFGVEGPVLIGAYGMGLNGWDFSYIFQNRDTGRYSEQIDEVWDVTVPNVLGVFPAVARMIHRGDVAQSPETYTLHVDPEELAEGTLNFEDEVTQAYDVKSFTTDLVPHEALAVGRVAVEFSEGAAPTEAVDVEEHADGGVLRSLTGQLAWRPGEHGRDGHATIDTPGTQGVVGFTRGEEVELGGVSIQTPTPYAAVLVTALGPGEDLATGGSALITTIARVRNEGQRMVAGTRVSEGEAPLRVEPVRATLAFTNGRQPRVYVLDHNGQRTGQEVPVRGGVVELDGAKHRTIYYEAVFERAAAK